MAAETLETAVREWVAEVTGWSADPAAVTVERVDGGYSWRTFLARRHDDRVVVRVAPAGGTVEPYDAAPEADVLGLASASGLPVTTVLAVDDGSRFETAAAIHRWLPGQVVRPGDDVAPADRDRYRTAFTEALARIHRDVPAEPATVSESYERVGGAEIEHYRSAAPCAHPGFEVAAGWLERHRPRVDEAARRVHGDYRLANLLWSAPGELSGILDWERSTTLDPMADVAFTRIFSGWCAVDAGQADRYRRISGVSVDEDRVEYARRFERWRSFTSAMRGLDALAAGRNDDVRLLRIGLAGEAGAWSLLDLLPDLEKQGTDLRHERWSYRTPIGGPVGGLHPTVAVADADARDAALTELRAVEGWPALRTALAENDPERSFALAHEAVLEQMSRTAGFSAAEVRPALRALARRATLRFEQLEERGWG